MERGGLLTIFPWKGKVGGGGGGGGVLEGWGLFDREGFIEAFL